MPQGRLGLISVEGKPAILEPGVHNFDTPRFFWGGLHVSCGPYAAGVRPWNGCSMVSAINAFHTTYAAIASGTVVNLQIP